MVDVRQAVPVVTVEELKKQLRITHDMEDDLLASLIVVASQNAEMRLHREIVRRTEDADAIAESVETVPMAIKQWCMMICGHLYAHREATVAQTLNELPFVHSLLDAWRLYE